MMIIVILSCFTIMVSAVPVTSNVLPALQTQGGATQTQRVQPAEVTNQKPEAQRPAVLPPSVEQPQSGVTQQPNPQLNPQLRPSLQQYMWSPQGGSPLVFCYCFQIFPPYGYIPLFSPPYTNQLVRSLLSSLFQMAAKMSQLGVYMPTVLTNQPAGAVQPERQAAGLTNPEQQGVAPTMGTSAAAIQQGQACSGSQPNANSVPAGLEGAAQEAATVQTSVRPKLQPTQGNLV
uniref:Uncharacterized protein n=1 Tax=Stegastes partitus TaxID=144197 RepID=A0A3B5AWT1_9TELE